MNLHYTMYCDVEITRRKRFHFIEDYQGHHVWSGRRLSDAIDWLYNQAATTVRLETHEAAYAITMARLTAEEQS